MLPCISGKFPCCRLAARHGMRAAVCAFLFFPAGPATAEATTEKPNFLVIVVDDLRAWGAGTALAEVETPNLDRFARQATVFTHAYAQYPACGPSRNSFLSGLRPARTGALLNTARNIRKFIPHVKTLPEWFKDHGYTTVGMGKLFHSDQDSPSWTRFFAFPPDITGYQAAGGRPATEFLDRPEENFPDGWLARRASEWLESEAATDDQPFLLMVGFLKPHLPFVAPRASFDSVGSHAVPAPAVAALPEGAPPYAGHNGYELRAYDDIPEGSAPIEPDKEAELRRGYAACVKFIDRQIGLILDALEASPYADNTHVFLFGDHGFHLGENGFWGKDSLFETSLRTSLLIRLAPAQGTPGSGLPDPETPIELTALYPTLVQLADLPYPYPLHGKSLFKVVREPVEAAFSVVQRHGKRIGFSVRDRRFRYTRWFDLANGRQMAEELYDYEAPRPEAVNRIADPCLSDERSRLSGLMDRHLQDSRYFPGSPVWGKSVKPPE